MFDLVTWLRSKIQPAAAPSQEDPDRHLAALTRREAERKLRAGGMSRTAAKRHLSELRRKHGRPNGE